MQIKSTLSVYLTPIKMAKIILSKVTQTQKDMYIHLYVNISS